MYEIETRFHMIPISWICGFGAYWEVFARGWGVLHGNLQVEWKSTHIPQQNFQFWWICGFGAYWELFAKGGGLFYMEIYR